MRNFHWSNIRSFNGSQDDGFEELVCQLARKEFENIHVDFIRKEYLDQCEKICNSTLWQDSQKAN